jgi:hypothetical protein
MPIFLGYPAWLWAIGLYFGKDYILPKPPQAAPPAPAPAAQAPAPDLTPMRAASRTRSDARCPLPVDAHSDDRMASAMGTALADDDVAKLRAFAASIEATHPVNAATLRVHAWHVEQAKAVMAAFAQASQGAPAPSPSPSPPRREPAAAPIAKVAAPTPAIAAPPPPPPPAVSLLQGRTGLEALLAELRTQGAPAQVIEVFERGLTSYAPPNANANGLAESTPPDAASTASKPTPLVP